MWPETTISPEERARRGVIAWVKNRALHILREIENCHPAAYLKHDPGPSSYCFVTKGQTATRNTYVTRYSECFELIRPNDNNGLTNPTAFDRTPLVLPAQEFLYAEQTSRIGRLDDDQYERLCRSMKWNLVLRGV